MLIVEMPAIILRYSARAVGIVPMGRGVLLGFPLGYARSCMAFAEGYSGESMGGSFDRLLVLLGGRADCHGRYTGRWLSGSRFGLGGSNAKLRFREVLCSGVKCQTDGCFNGGELQVQPSFQARESRFAGEGDISVLSLIGGAKR